MTTGPGSQQPSNQDPNQPAGAEYPQQPAEQPAQQPGQPPYAGPPPHPAQPPYPGQPMPPSYGAPVPGQMRPDDEKLWAIAAHLGPLILGFIAPLIVWLVFKDRSRFLDRHGKEALNFQISLMIYMFVSFILVFLLIGILLMFVVGIAALVLMILATVKAANFEDYRYPATIRFVK